MKAPVFVAALAVACAMTIEASAAPPWIHRRLTLPSGDWAFDLGLGLGHAEPGLAPGFNVELGVGVARRLELGVRLGFRPGDSSRAAAADAYGRLFDTETYATGGETVANPELLLRGRIVSEEVVELGLEARIEVPFDPPLGVLLGVPLVLHLGNVARLDAGVYVSLLFHDPAQALVSFPVHLWFQATPQLWLGPLLGVRVHDGGGSTTQFGVGLGYQASRSLDFKTELFFQDVSHDDARAWGLGVGIQARVE